MAPTVLTSTTDAVTTVRALRAAGHLPVVEYADCAVQVPRRPEPPAARRQPPQARTEASPDDAAETTGEQDVDIVLHEVATAPAFCSVATAGGHARYRPSKVGVASPALALRDPSTHRSAGAVPEGGESRAASLRRSPAARTATLWDLVGALGLGAPW